MGAITYDGSGDIFKVQITPTVASIGEEGSAAPTSVDLLGGEDTGGLLQPLLLDTGGFLKVGLYKYGGTDVTLGQKTSAASIPVVLASDQTSSAPSTPSSIETASNRAYTITREVTLGNGGTEIMIKLIRNPIGSGKRMFVRHVHFGNTLGSAKSTTLRVYANPTLTGLAVTFQDAGNTVTRATHGFVNGDVVSFATIVTTTGISINTNYFVVGAAANTFQVSLTSGGPAINLVTNGSGTVYGTGISVAPLSLNVGGGAAASLMLVTENPTITTTGSKLTVETQTNEENIVEYDWGLIVNAGHSVLFTAAGSANNVPFTTTITWTEAV